MKKHIFTVLLLTLFLSNSSLGSEDDEHELEEEQENISKIEDTMAKKVGVGTSIASAQTLHQTITVFGALASGPEQISHVRARYEGLIKSVAANIGDHVGKGDLLVTVESNESLKTYPIRSPIKGVIVRRHVNTGEVTQGQVLVSVANFEKLWAELRIYPTQQTKVTTGQSVYIIVSDRTLEGVITHIIPALNNPYLIARIELENEDLSLSPGLPAEGRIVVNSLNVDVAVNKEAIQTLRGNSGVFVKHEEEYEFIPLILGEMDNQNIEVLEGLEEGTEYVSENSFLIKADILKSEVEDDD
ncbi:MAG: HlyD family efflux transporter periplasmic adaptor subunit [Chloroflexi bacterium]|nr:MAG: HlyD family efflux transporter periplasmic adaptor subunit [Chloroflexota bacterium]